MFCAQSASIHIKKESINMSSMTDKVFYRRVVTQATEENCTTLTSLVLNEIKRGGIKVPQKEHDLVLLPNISLKDIYRIVALVFLNLAKDDLEMREVFLKNMEFFLMGSSSSFSDIGSSLEEVYRLELELELEPV